MLREKSMMRSRWGLVKVQDEYSDLHEKSHSFDGLDHTVGTATDRCSHFPAWRFG
jgi:hypothetical protein